MTVTSAGIVLSNPSGSQVTSHKYPGIINLSNHAARFMPGSKLAAINPSDNCFISPRAISPSADITVPEARACCITSSTGTGTSAMISQYPRSNEAAIPTCFFQSVFRNMSAPNRKTMAILCNTPTHRISVSKRNSTKSNRPKTHKKIPTAYILKARHNIFL